MRRVSEVRGKVMVFFSVLLSHPTLSLFLAVLCFYLPLGWKAQCKIWRCWFCFSLSPRTQGQEDTAAASLTSCPCGTFRAPVLSAQQLLGTTQLALQGQESRRSWEFPFPRNEAVPIGQKGGDAAEGQALGCPLWYCRSSGGAQFCAVWYHILTDS